MTYSLSSKAPLTPPIKTAQLAASLKFLFPPITPQSKGDLAIPATTNQAKKNNG